MLNILLTLRVPLLPFEGRVTVNHTKFFPEKSPLSLNNIYPDAGTPLQELHAPLPALVTDH